MDETAVADYEARFRRAGLPLLIEGRTASRDVWTRATPLLVLVFAVEALGAIDLRWTWWQNLLALAGAAALLLATWAARNRMRGKPALARPDDIGRLELAGFVVLPALLPLLFNGQAPSAAVTAAGNLALLAVLYAVIAYGLLSIVAWAGGRLLGQLVSSVMLLARAIPLLLLFSVVLFINTEMWQTFAGMRDANLIAIAGLLVAIGSLFLAGRLPREVSALESAVGEGPPLSARQRLNVALVMFVSQALQVLVVALAVAAFFTAFGLLATPASLIDTWTGSQPRTVVSLLGVDLSRELLHVAGAIGAFSGLYYAIATLTDATYREEFLADITDEMRATFHARVDYLALRSVPRT